MVSLFAGVHIKEKSNEFIKLMNVDLEKDVSHLREELALRLQHEKKNLEIISNGNVLNDDSKLSDVVKPNDTVHCFCKTRKYKKYEAVIDPDKPSSIASIQALFSVITHIQISVSSRVNILQKIVTEYPEFRHNLGAQALIRDSVLFNTFPQTEVITNIAKYYPIICDAAPFIVDTIKKEVLRNQNASNISEPATDSNNSSEEENSLGGNGSLDRSSSDTSARSQESARIRTITRQQLQSALAQIGVGSINSLSNIAQRYSDDSFRTSTPLRTSASGDRIASELVRNELERAVNDLNEHLQTHQMETDDIATAPTTTTTTTTTETDALPSQYRSHRYASELRTMVQMGFLNYEDNILYLGLANGNIENAVNLLMGSHN